MQATPTQYSILDLASVKAGGTIAEAFRHALDIAQHAEKLGFTRYWLAEHHNMEGIASAATAVLIGHIAGGTTKIRVGSGGIMLPNHSSLVIAEQFGTLETLYPGRIDLGLGRAPGGDPAASRALGRGARSIEEDFPRQVAELLAYLAPAVPGQAVRAVPGAGTNVPVWLLGSSTYSAQLAAAMGLPFAFASHFAPDLLFDAIAIYRSQFKPSRYAAKPWLAAAVPAIAAETDEEADYLATSPMLRFLSLIRGGPLFTPPPVASMDGRWSNAERSLVLSKLGVAIVGGPETIRERFANFVRETGVDEIIMTSDIFDHQKRLRSFELAAAAMQSLPEKEALTANFHHQVDPIQPSA